MPQLNGQTYIVTPGQNTGIVLTVDSGATCTLSQKGVTGGPVMTLFADSNGQVDIWINPSAPLDTLVMTLAWNNSSQDIEFTTNGVPSAMEVPLAAAAKGKVRPALTPQQIQNMPDEDLLAGGYPLRPHPKDVPDAYEAWKAVVSVPSTTIVPSLTSHPFLTCNNFIPGTHPNWCGFELEDPSVISDWITAKWVLPEITARVGYQDYLATWVGIDDGSDQMVWQGKNLVHTTDMVQAGVEQNCFAVAVETTIVSFFQNYVWVQLSPNENTMQIITNFSVKTGDEVQVQVWIGNDAKPYFPGLSGSCGVFHFENITTGLNTKVYTALGAKTVAAGAHAEWIVERPSLMSGADAGLTSLAQFAPFNMIASVAHRNVDYAEGNGAFVHFRTAQTGQYSMTQASEPVVICSVAVATDIPNAMTFTWAGYE